MYIAPSSLHPDIAAKSEKLQTLLTKLPVPGRQTQNGTTKESKDATRNSANNAEQRAGHVALSRSKQVAARDSSAGPGLGC